MNTQRSVFHNRSLVYEKPPHLIWTDKLVQYVINKVKQGFTYNQIAKELKVHKTNIQSIIYKRRKKPEWAGKIPYLKVNQRPIFAEQSDRIGVFDIEVHSGFYANRGFMLSYSIKEHNKQIYHTGLINPKHIRQGHYDKFLCESLVKDIIKFDVIVGFYSGDRKFDLPYARTRCAKNGIAFPFYNTIKQIDLHKTIKYKFKLDHNTLNEACKIFGIKGKTKVDFQDWQKFVYQGNRQMGASILKYNMNDTKITDELFSAVKNYDSMYLSSI